MVTDTVLDGLGCGWLGHTLGIQWAGGVSMMYLARLGPRVRGLQPGTQALTSTHWGGGLFQMASIQYRMFWVVGRLPPGL